MMGMKERETEPLLLANLREKVFAMYSKIMEGGRYHRTLLSKILKVSWISGPSE